ncbi:MAG: ATP-dependent Clp protease adaptor protein ClpS [Lentimonas sp.]|jgi:ATP-dependent Clp protease adaptor protein ClpS
MTITETSGKTSILEQLVEEKDLIVYNDEFNTFDFVIEALIKVCDHDKIQAEQCTMLIHHKGKCQVKRGEFKDLMPMCTSLLERGITAEIE